MHLRGRHYFVIDIVLITLAYLLAFGIRFDLVNPIPYYQQFGGWLAGLILIRLPIFYYFGLYRHLWRYASVRELLTIVTAVSLGSILALAVTFVFASLIPNQPWISGFPRSILALEWLLTLLLVGASRYAARIVTELRDVNIATTSKAKRTLIIGAGDSGAALAREIQNNPHLKLRIVGFVDDDSAKLHQQIRSVPVIGTRSQLRALADQANADLAIIAMPTASGKIIRETVQWCSQAGLETRIVPGMYQLLDGRVSVRRLRTVEVGDLLGRSWAKGDTTFAAKSIAGRTVLVTGAGGSIGAELCRQIAFYKPKQLVLLGHGENSIFEIHQELSARFPDLATSAIIADIRDRPRIMDVFSRVAPDVVFHAAAHKHVPLMEQNISEAITNNVFGTANILAASETNQVRHVVLISTDKAVRPISVMGATKRLAELLVMEAARRTGWAYTVVRFGNVLGSRGSVVPIFQNQIAAGGPVSVTHPEMKRYFMTIPEAVQLVLRAGTLSKGGEVFVLNMGEQIRIVDLAQDIIRLSGLEVGRDIDIVFTGIRPGEKLEEELFLDSEAYEPTADGDIYMSRNKSTALPENFLTRLEELQTFISRGEEADALTLLQQLLPDFAVHRRDEA